MFLEFEGPSVSINRVSDVEGMPNVGVLKFPRAAVLINPKLFQRMRHCLRMRRPFTR